MYSGLLARSIRFFQTAYGMFPARFKLGHAKINISIAIYDVTYMSRIIWNQVVPMPTITRSFRFWRFTPMKKYQTDSQLHNMQLHSSYGFWRIRRKLLLRPCVFNTRVPNYSSNQRLPALFLCAQNAAELPYAMSHHQSVPVRFRQRQTTENRVGIYAFTTYYYVVLVLDRPQNEMNRTCVLHAPLTVILSEWARVLLPVLAYHHLGYTCRLSKGHTPRNSFDSFSHRGLWPIGGRKFAETYSRAYWRIAGGYIHCLEPEPADCCLLSAGHSGSGAGQAKLNVLGPHKLRESNPSRRTYARAILLEHLTHTSLLQKFIPIGLNSRWENAQTIRRGICQISCKLGPAYN